MIRKQHQQGQRQQHQWFWRIAVVVWVAVIWTLSSAPFRSEQSQRVVDQSIDYVFGAGVTPANVATASNDVLRKGAHITEYAILGWLLYFAFSSGPGWDRRAAQRAFFCAVLLAGVDEIHQSFVPGRDASSGDAAIDSAGALLSILILYRLKNFYPSCPQRHPPQHPPQR